MRQAATFSITNSAAPPTLPKVYTLSTMGPDELNDSVRNGKRCDLIGIDTANKILEKREDWKHCRADREMITQTISRSALPPTSSLNVEYLNFPFMIPRFRNISTARLNALLRFHLRPINVVVSHDPFPSLRTDRCLISGYASRLDAFSAYHVQT